MKTAWRILVIVTAFVIAMGLIYVVVDATGNNSGATPQFERENGLAFEGVHPDLPQDDGGREFREGRGGGWMFSLIKNLGLVAVIVMLVTVPKTYRQKKRVAVPTRVE